MSEPNELDKAGFDHPCKSRCSGWSQGRTRGRMDMQPLRVALEAIRDDNRWLRKMEYIDRIRKVASDALEGLK